MAEYKDPVPLTGDFQFRYPGPFLFRKKLPIRSDGWVEVSLQPEGWRGFFLQKTPMEVPEWGFEPLPSFSSLNAFLELFVVNAFPGLPRDASALPTNKSPEGIGYLVVLPRTVTPVLQVSGILARPLRPWNDTRSGGLLLRLADLAVHHYPGRLSSVTDGTLPGQTEELLTGV